MQHVPEIENESYLKPVGKLTNLIDAMTVLEMTIYLLAASKAESERTTEEQNIIDRLSFLL